MSVRNVEPTGLPGQTGLRAVSGKLYRPLIGALMLVFVLAGMSGAAEARRPPRQQQGGIVVDVSPLLATGLGSFAEQLRAELTADLEGEFSGRLAPGTRLVVVVHSLSLNSDVGNFIGGFGHNDYLDGVATLVGPHGEQLAQQKILAVSPMSSGGAWYQEGWEQRRTAALARMFTYWTGRYIAT